MYHVHTLTRTMILALTLTFLVSSLALAQTGSADSAKATPTSTEATEQQPDPEKGQPVPPDTMPKQPVQTPADTTAKRAAETAKPAPVAPESKSEEPVDPTAPYKNIKFAPGEKPRVVMETTQGKMVIELWPDVAMKHSQSFAYLVGKGFYDSLTFHRVVPGFVIQGGDPQGTGMGGPGYSVPAEFSTTLKHEEGILSMARSQDPNSGGSQFFIVCAKAPHLDGKYTIFGKVVEGLDVLHKIESVPRQQERPVTKVVMTKVYMQPKS